MLLSIIGLYEYDNNLFEGLQLPEGLSREAVINEILLQCAELEIMYPNIDISITGKSYTDFIHIYTSLIYQQTETLLE